MSIVAREAHLDELVRRQRDVDFVQDGRRQPVVSNEDDRMQVMRAGAQVTAKRRDEGLHRSIIVATVMTSPLNPSGRKHRFGKAWMHEHVSDPYVREANRRGYRSRAAFKLQELGERDRLFRRGITAVDLGAAPGSWTQVLREELGREATIVAVDLLPMQGLAGVQCLQVDLGDDDGVGRLDDALASRPVDLVVSDMSPNLSGIDVADQARSIRLAELALDFAMSHLQPGGDLVVKVFQGAGLDAFQREFRRHFTKTYLRKPKASRDRSREHYLVGKGFVANARLSLSGDNR